MLTYPGHAPAESALSTSAGKDGKFIAVTQRSLEGREMFIGYGKDRRSEGDCFETDTEIYHTHTHTQREREKYMTRT